MSLFTNDRKEEIAEDLRIYARKFRSQNKAAVALNISPATLSAIINDKWENISDGMWRIIRDQVSTKKDNWEIVLTPTFKHITTAIRTAHDEQISLWLTSRAGSGKSTAAKVYKSEHNNVIYLLCDEDMRKLSFATELARAAGLRLSSGNARDKMMAVIDYISEMDNPLIIFDEGDKLTDSLLYYFITVYNLLEGKAGIIFLSTDYMQKRMANGLLRNHKGYQEISSRIGSKFIEAKETTPSDIAAICKANGLGGKLIMNDVIREAEQYKFDLRRVERRIKAMRKKIYAKKYNDASNDN